jgi:hypothetical protein
MDTPSFADGLGRRIAAHGADGERVESLRLCTEIPATAATQAALVERAARLADFEHPSFATVRRIERFGGPGGGLAIISEPAAGVRLSDLLRQSDRRLADRDLDAALQLLQQVAASIGALHAHGRDLSHGAIGPERLVVCPDGRVMVVEYVLGTALEALQMSRSQLWGLFRVPAPSSAGSVRFDQQADVLQVGMVALALFLGRMLRREEFPQGLPEVLEEAAAPDARRNYPGLPRPLRGWTARSLQFDSRTSFRSTGDAERALAAAIAESKSCRPSRAAVQRFLAGCSFEALSSPAVPSSLRPSPSGAVVIVGPQPDVTRRIAPSEGQAGFDRGSGAHRVSRQPAAEHGTGEVLADFAGMARPDRVKREAPASPPSEPAAAASSGIGRAPGAPRRNWLSRLREALPI